MPKKSSNGKTKDLARESLQYVENQRSYDKAVMKIAFARTQNGLEPYWGAIRIFHKSDKVDVKEERNDYGSLILASYALSASDVAGFLKSIAENQYLKLPDDIVLKFQDYAESLFLYSNEDYGSTLKHSWPCNNLLLSFPQVTVDHYTKLVKRGLPMYPDPHTAIRDFLKLEHELVSTADTGRYLLIQMPDFRARITDVTVTGNSVKLSVETKDISHKSLITKIYMENETASYKSEDLAFNESKTISCEADFEPTSINICILDESDRLVDARDINLRWFRYTSDVKIVTPSLQVKELAQRGETDNVEFKRELSNNKNEILEAVTAFSNASGGIILIGIEDDTTICGCNEDEKRLRDSLRDSINSKIEPRGIKFEIEQVKINGSNSDEEKKTVFLVRIPEGGDKPYRFYDKGFLLRRGSSNRPMTRHELDEIYQKKSRDGPLVGGPTNLYV